MKIFISWSGDLSKNIAELLATWIGSVLQGVEAWISTEDINKGTIWFGDISKALSETGVGIICLTSYNLNAPWILFEAGALSKGLSKSRVCPLLVNITHQELKPPLSQFNATLPTKDDMLKLIKLINAENGERKLPEDRVPKVFEKWWSEFDDSLKKIVAADKSKDRPVQRSPEDILAEVLELTRSIQTSLQQEKKPIPFGAGLLNYLNQNPQPFVMPPAGPFSDPFTQILEAFEKRQKKLPVELKNGPDTTKTPPAD